MGHWAEIDENNIVIRVIVIKEAELDLKKREAAIEMALKRKELQLKESELKLNQAELVLESVQERPVAIGKT